MKINYETYPVLEDLLNESIDSSSLIEDDKVSFSEYADYFNKSWKSHQKDFKENIFFVSETFIDACMKASDKLFKIMDDDAIELKFSETYFYWKYIFCAHVEKIGKGLLFDFYWFEKKGGLLLFQTTETFDIKSKLILLFDQEFSIWRSRHLQFNSDVDYKKAAYTSLFLAIYINLFKKYASVETKILQPNQKIKLDNGIKHKNETKLPITYLDSKWFTNLVKSDAFKVRGHFRLQPKIMNGEWTKELIWISDFMKKGYTSHAKISDQTK